MINREYHRRKALEWGKKNPEQKFATNRIYYFNHVEERREKARLKQKERRLLVLNYYGGTPPTCACCNEYRYEFLAIDHINDDGNKERKSIGGYREIANFLIQRNLPSGYQVLCHNCNFAKSHYIGGCPHKLEK